MLTVWENTFDNCRIRNFYLHSWKWSPSHTTISNTPTFLRRCFLTRLFAFFEAKSWSSSSDNVASISPLVYWEFHRSFSMSNENANTECVVYCTLFPHDVKFLSEDDKKSCMLLRHLMTDILCLASSLLWWVFYLVKKRYIYIHTYIVQNDTIGPYLILGLLEYIKIRVFVDGILS